MRESIYGNSLIHKVSVATGGLPTKISDKSTLGLPDYSIVKDSIVTYIETKIGKTSDLGFFPFDAVNDNRQFQVCKRLGHYALVLFAIYYPKQKCSLIIRTTEFEEYSDYNPKSNKFVVPGHGDDRVVAYMKKEREILRGKLQL